MCYNIPIRVNQPELKKASYKMAKSFSKRQYEQVYVSNLLAVQSRREETRPEGMSLDTFYKGLGQSVKAQYQAGNITSEAYESRMRQLISQYRELKGAA